MRHRRRWSVEDDRLLAYYWGLLDLGGLAGKLQRSVVAVSVRAKKRRLPPRRKTLAALARSSGYSRSRLWTAIEVLKILPQRTRRTDPRQPPTLRTYAFTAEQEREILLFLGAYPRKGRLLKMTGGKTPKGMWGVGRKPPACTVCFTTDRPHYARGLCARCYDRIRGMEQRDEPWKTLKK